MIDGQDYNKHIKIEKRRDVVVVTMPDKHTHMTGEAAIKLGHDLIGAGEAAAKQSGELHEYP